MDKLSLSILLGLAIGIIDIIPMIIKKLPKYSTVSAFIHYFIATIIIANISIPQLTWWIEGGVLGFLLILPMLIHVGHTDKNPLPVITINAIVLGSVVEIVSHFILK
jgi:formate-dependent nitrite reductase membrane component NrfD